MKLEIQKVNTTIVVAFKDKAEAEHMIMHARSRMPSARWTIKILMCLQGVKLHARNARNDCVNRLPPFAFSKEVESRWTA